MTLETGEKAINFSIPATDAKAYSLEDFKDKKAVLIVFMCNHCPYVKSRMDELKRIQSSYPDVAVVGISSNDAERFPEDSFENMKKTAQEKNFNFPYLYDETQEIAKAYGAVCTPDPFLFDSEGKLILHSRIDDGGREQGENKEMFDAIGEFLKTGKISMKETPPFGCSIKWKV